MTDAEWDAAWEKREKWIAQAVCLLHDKEFSISQIARMLKITGERVRRHLRHLSNRNRQDDCPTKQETIVILHDAQWPTSKIADTLRCHNSHVEKTIKRHEQLLHTLARIPRGLLPARFFKLRHRSYYMHFFSEAELNAIERLKIKTHKELHRRIDELRLLRDFGPKRTQNLMQKIDEQWEEYHD